MQMKIINEKIKQNIREMSKAVKDEDFADGVSSERFEFLQKKFEET